MENAGELQPQFLHWSIPLGANGSSVVPTAIKCRASPIDLPFTLLLWCCAHYATFTVDCCFPFSTKLTKIWDIFHMTSLLFLCGDAFCSVIVVLLFNLFLCACNLWNCMQMAPPPARQQKVTTVSKESKSTNQSNRMQSIMALGNGTDNNKYQ